MASLIVPLISSFYFFSFVKPAISYMFCYSIDKKAYRRIKNILKRVVGIKQMLTFVDEKKGTIKFVTPFFQSYFSPSANYTSFFPYFVINNIMYARTSIYIAIPLFPQYIGTLREQSRQIKKKVPDKHFFISGELVPLVRTFRNKRYALQKSKA